MNAFKDNDKIGLQELDEHLRIKIGIIDTLSGDVGGIYPGATKVENLGNGKIKINDVEVTVYAHPITHPASMISGLATVATSGKYSDLSGLPTELPASDVHPWAKAVNKPTYTPDDVKAIAAAKKGVADGVAELDSLGKVPIDQLPDNLQDLASTGFSPSGQIPILDITEKLTDNAGKTLIIGGLSSSFASISSEDLDAATVPTQL